MLGAGTRGGDDANETGAIAAVTRALLHFPSNADVQRHGCSALASLAARAPSGRVPAARAKGAAAAAPAALTWACGEGADNPIVAHTRVCACEALRCLAALPGCRQEACAAGALEALTRLLCAPRLLDTQVQVAGDGALLALITDDAACQKRALAAGALELPASAHIALLALLRGCVADGQRAAAADADAAAAALLAELDAESAAAAAAQHKRKAKQQKKQKQAHHADAAADHPAGASGSGAAGEPAQASHAADLPSGSSGDAACEAAPSASAKRRQKRTAAKTARRGGGAPGGAAGRSAPDDADDAAGSSAAAAAPDEPDAHAPDEQADVAAPAAVDAAPPDDDAIAPAALFMQQMFPFLQLAGAGAAAALPPEVAPPAVPAPAVAPEAAAAAAKEEEEDASLCVICLDARRCVALMPCKHLALCAAPACAVMLGAPPLCPLCRVPVADTLQLFV